jgi:hypothetical protein
MSKWGVFRIDDDSVHVAPCDTDGSVLPPHALTDDCECIPRQDIEEPRLKVHRDPKRSEH